MSLTKAKIFHVPTQTLKTADVFPLSEEIARDLIDNVWWEKISPTLMALEMDNHWRWEEKIIKRKSNILYDFVAIESDEEYLEGAMIYLSGVESQLNAQNLCGWIDYLASAPRNREWLVDSPLYKGIGSAFLYWAILRSYRTGLKGRIRLESLPSENTIKFYERKGFVKTNFPASEEGLVSYELPENMAMEILLRGGV